MTCAELEILLCDYVDGTLRGEEKTASRVTWPDAARARSWPRMSPVRRLSWNAWPRRNLPRNC